MSITTENLPNPYDALTRLGLELSQIKLRAGWFDAARSNGDLLFTSGQIAAADGVPVASGHLGGTVDTATGVRCARQAMLNVLSLIHQSGHDLRQWRPLKITVSISATPDFEAIGEVATGASQLLLDVWGEHYGSHARSGHSMPALAGGTPIEVEAVFERIHA